ncbi:hypothetical protein RHMOL_Rhmol02G0318900 [Rhododendron molle]|uniref:Uncharacterized protein n=1 Tax=Rhododendron molle TaxID=49168 RepID=A0ACC0PWK0_RHOML|nr:hypothetical protein RHMOL_Rhmol02G0318900 [Rhododendron molle]
MRTMLSTKSAKKATIAASNAQSWHRSVSIGSIVNCGIIVITRHQQIVCAVDCLINLLLDSIPSFGLGMLSASLYIIGLLY